MEEVLGIDVGGVIIAAANADTDTSFFGGNYLHSKAEEWVFESVQQLVAERFGEHTHIISKCGPNTERKTLEWLDHNRFYERTGLPRGNVHFCRTRAGKAPICTKLGITHFIDDRLDVHRHLTTVPQKFLFRGHDHEIKKYAHLMSDVHHVQNWREVCDTILR